MKKIILLSAFSLVLFTGCHGVGGHVRVGGGYSQPMPPSHAPAHGRRLQHRYHYYPNAEIYFDIGRNMYFYLDSSNRWSFSVNLPIYLRHHLHSGYVEFEMDNDRPYSRHQYHKKKYKNYKFKNKLKYNRKKRYDSRERYDDRERYDGKRKYKSKEKNRRYDDRERYDDNRKYKSREKKRRYDDRERYDDKRKYKSKEKKQRKKDRRNKYDEDDDGRGYKDEKYE